MDPFVGQVSIFAFSFAPKGWAFCQGQMMPISQNTALFSILGTAYGGNGATTFALPNLQGCAAVGAGQGPALSEYPLGEQGGVPHVTLSAAELPSHRHPFTASRNVATAQNPQGNLLARATRQGGRGADAGAPAPGPTQIEADFYSPNPGNAKTALASGTIGPSGEGRPHNNMQPYLMLNFCIALQGAMPRRG